MLGKSVPRRPKIEQITTLPVNFALIEPPGRAFDPDGLEPGDEALDGRARQAGDRCSSPLGSGADGAIEVGG